MSSIAAGTAVPPAVASYYERVDAGDVPGLIELFERDATYERPGYPPFVGVDALRLFYTSDRVIDRGTHDILQCVSAANHAAVQGRFHGQLRDGRQVDLRFADFFELTQRGLIGRRCTYFYEPAV